MQRIEPCTRCSQQRVPTGKGDPGETNQETSQHQSLPRHYDWKLANKTWLLLDSRKQRIVTERAGKMEKESSSKAESVYKCQVQEKHRQKVRNWWCIRKWGVQTWRWRYDSFSLICWRKRGSHNSRWTYLYRDPWQWLERDENPNVWRKQITTNVQSEGIKSN